MTQLQSALNHLDFALEHLREGKFVLVHDSADRENEVDMVVAAEHVSPDHVEAMRTKA